MGNTQLWGGDEARARRWLDIVLPLDSRASPDQRRLVLDGFKVMMRSPVAAEVMKLGHDEVFVDAVRRLFAIKYLSPLQYLQCAIDIFPFQYRNPSDVEEEEDTPALLLVQDALKTYKTSSEATRGRIGPELLFKVFANGYPSHVVSTLLDISPNLAVDLMEAHPWYAMHAERGAVLRPYTSPLANALLFQGNARPEYARSYLDVIISRHPCALNTMVEETGTSWSSLSLVEGLLLAKTTLYDGYVSIWKQLVSRIIRGHQRGSYVSSVVTLLEHIGVHEGGGSSTNSFTRKDLKQALDAFKLTFEEWVANRSTLPYLQSDTLAAEIAAYFGTGHSASQHRRRVKQSTSTSA